MWFDPDDMETARGPRVRHEAKQDDRLLRYGWIRHDGRSYGRQTLFDEEYNITVTMVKRFAPTSGPGGDWAVRLQVGARQAGRQAGRHPCTPGPKLGAGEATVASATGAERSLRLRGGASKPDVYAGLAGYSPLSMGAHVHWLLWWLLASSVVSYNACLSMRHTLPDATHRKEGKGRSGAPRVQCMHVVHACHAGGAHRGHAHAAPPHLAAHVHWRGGAAHPPVAGAAGGRHGHARPHAGMGMRASTSWRVGAGRDHMLMTCEAGWPTGTCPMTTAMAMAMMMAPGQGGLEGGQGVWPRLPPPCCANGTGCPALCAHEMPAWCMYVMPAWCVHVVQVMPDGDPGDIRAEPVTLVAGGSACVGGSFSLHMQETSECVA